MTKVTIIGEQSKEERKLKPIEFVKSISMNGKDCYVINKPSEWKNIELICKRQNNTMDILFAYDYDRSKGMLYLGYFNDGIVE